MSWERVNIFVVECDYCHRKHGAGPFENAVQMAEICKQAGWHLTTQPNLAYCPDCWHSHKHFHPSPTEKVL